jgi:hypothetical protein
LATYSWKPEDQGDKRPERGFPETLISHCKRGAQRFRWENFLKIIDDTFFSLAKTKAIALALNPSAGVTLIEYIQQVCYHKLVFKSKGTKHSKISADTAWS